MVPGGRTPCLFRGCPDHPPSLVGDVNRVSGKDVKTVKRTFYGLPCPLLVHTPRDHLVEVVSVVSF